MSPEQAAYAAMMRQYKMTGGMLPHFRSSVGVQRGRGIGGFFGSLVRRVIPLFSRPIVKKGLKTVGKAAATALLEAGQKAIAEQEPFHKALKSSSRAQAQQLMTQALKHRAPPIGRNIKRPRMGRKAINPKRAAAAKRKDIFT